jgi:hypothetical protein
MGDGQGVRGRLKELLPRLIFVWCPPHRTNLCLQDANEAGGENFAALEATLREIYTYIKGSPKRRAALAEVCDVLGVPFLKPVNWAAPRWSSRYDRSTAA